MSKSSRAEICARQTADVMPVYSFLF